MPPSAATTGSVIRWRSRSEPMSNSRLASSPTTRKKNVISPSLTQRRSSIEMPSVPTRIESLVLQNESYESDQGELAQTSAATTAPSSTVAPADSVLRKSRTGAARLRAQAVRPLNGRVSEAGRVATWGRIIHVVASGGLTSLLVLALAAAVGPASSAAPKRPLGPGCDRSRPAVAHHARAARTPSRGRARPVPCMTFAAQSAESALIGLTRSGKVVYAPRMDNDA